MDELFPRAMPFFAVLFVWTIAFIGIRHKRLRGEARRDVQLALLNKFQTGEEITKFLATAEGRRLLDQLMASEDDLQHKITALVIPGCILTSIGIALAICSKVIGKPDLLIASFVVGAVGIGFFIALALARRILAGMGPNAKDD